MDSIFIRDEHCGRDASPALAKRVVELLRAAGWQTVRYGSGPHWPDMGPLRETFDHAFEATLRVAALEQEQC